MKLILLIFKNDNKFTDHEIEVIGLMLTILLKNEDLFFEAQNEIKDILKQNSNNFDKELLKQNQIRFLWLRN